jgi:hypothetical protein
VEAFLRTARGSTFDSLLLGAAAGQGSERKRGAIRRNRAASIGASLTSVGLPKFDVQQTAQLYRIFIDSPCARMLLPTSALTGHQETQLPTR